VQRFRAALLALGLLAVTAGVGMGVLAERTGEDLDHRLRLAGASRVAALDDYAERARAVTLVASHSAAFVNFYRAPGTREERIRGASGDADLMHRVHTALSDLGLLFHEDIAAAGFIDRSGAENAVVVRGDEKEADELSSDAGDAVFFDRAFELLYDKVYQTAPYRSAATGEWVIAFAAKVNIGAGVSPAVVYFEVTVESFRLASYSEDPQHRVRVVDLLDGRVVIDSTLPQDMDNPLGNPRDRSLRWVQTTADGDVRSAGGMRHVVQHAAADSTIGTSWAVVVSVPEPTGAWAGPGAPGPVGLVVVGIVLLGLSVVGYLRHGRFMHRTARRDELTTLHNRLAAREIADALLAKERRLAVILFDLDRFKHVNDSLGHHAGDHLLAVIGDRLADVVRDPDDVVARLGGDEFVVLARGVRDEETAAVLCERLARAISAPVTIDGLDVSVGSSIGIALAPEHGSDFGTLLQHADIAMYHAKGRRTGWQVYRDDLAPNDRTELTLDADLRRAVADGDLEIHYQPSYSLVTDAVTRVEALVRWRHPGRGLLMPGSFVPFAERTGAIKLVTRAVLTAALDQVVAWRATGRDVTVSVNVSAHDVADHSFADRVTAELSARGLPGSSLLVELTETALLADPETAGEVLGRLAAAGVGVAVDDFGAGYASLLYLRRFPVSVLKLDRTLVQGLTVDQTDEALVRWTVEMAHSLGVTCVAEGVEDADTMQALVDLSCDEAQGYHLQAPCGADELVLHALARDPV
jgi:diguanylate cyclase (GGDEF)-like protein